MKLSLGETAENFIQKFVSTKGTKDQKLAAAREELNVKSLAQLVDLNEKRMHWADRLQRHMEATFNAIMILSAVAFAMGIVMIVIPFLAFYFSASRDQNLLWFSGLGLGETLAVLIYKPMQRMQEAISDLVQAIIITNSWVTQVGLTLHKMDSSQDRPVDEATKMISELTSKHVKLLQDYVEAKGHQGKPVKKAQETALAPPAA